jgi:hypothetical protein
MTSDVPAVSVPEKQKTPTVVPRWLKDLTFLHRLIYFRLYYDCPTSTGQRRARTDCNNPFVLGITGIRGSENYSCRF